MAVVRPGRNAAAYREIDVSRLQIKIIETRQQVNATRPGFGVPASGAAIWRSRKDRALTLGFPNIKPDHYRTILPTGNGADR